jgi:FkbM family methyltransferase
MLTETLQRAVRRLGFRLERWRPANRFGAMSDALSLLFRLGYRPRAIIDGGANRGQWFAAASRVFSPARYELIEPVPACHPALESLAASSTKVTLHKVALTAPGRSTLAMAGGTAAGGTGSFVVDHDDPRAQIVCPATTLDSLFAGELRRDDRTLLKLDLEGHEMEALQGASELLPNVEVAVVEAQFFPIAGNGLPCFDDVVRFMHDCGFITYDVATLGGRRRDGRLVLGDVVFVRASSALCADVAWW